MFASRNIEHIRQIPEKLLDVTLQPLMFVLLFAYVFGGAIAVQGGNYREYIIAGILMQSLAFGLTGPGDRDLDRPHRRCDRPVPLAAGHAHGVSRRPLSSPSSPAWCCRSSSCSPPGSSSAGACTPTCSTSRLALVLLLTFASAMIWIGTWIGLDGALDRRGDGHRLHVVFPLTFLSNAFVPIDSLPTVLQWFAIVEPGQRDGCGDPGAVRQSDAPVTQHTWPIDHPMPDRVPLLRCRPRDRGAGFAAALPRPHQRLTTSRARIARRRSRRPRPHRASPRCRRRRGARQP